MGLFVGGLLGMTYQPVIIKAVQPDLGPRPSRTRYQRKLVEYLPGVLDQPITRQVMRAELRAIALQDEKNRLNNWAGFRGKDKKHGSRAIARANVFPYVNARCIDQLFNLDYRPGIRVWLDRSGRPS